MWRYSISDHHLCLGMGEKYPCCLCLLCILSTVLPVPPHSPRWLHSSYWRALSYRCRYTPLWRRAWTLLPWRWARSTGWCQRCPTLEGEKGNYSKLVYLQIRAATPDPRVVLQNLIWSWLCFYEGKGYLCYWSVHQGLGVFTRAGWI